MATILPKITEYTGNVKQVFWETITHADDGGTTKTTHADSPETGGLGLLAYPDKTISAAGTFGGGLSLALQGSSDGTNWHPCHSLGGTITASSAIALTTTLQSAVVAQNFRYYRLIRTSGSASDVDVTMTCVR